MKWLHRGKYPQASLLSISSDEEDEESFACDNVPNSARGTDISRVQVSVRCRPIFGLPLAIEVIGDTLQVRSQIRGGQLRSYRFDHVLDCNAMQPQVYDCIARPLVEDVLRGINGTVIAYGQTGTGKTYTMGLLNFKSQDDAGIIPRAFAHIFDYIERKVNERWSVRVSFLQIYLENIQDLLTNSSGMMKKTTLSLGESPDKGVFVKGLNICEVCSYSEAYELIRYGTRNRAVASTDSNRNSSRSHTVLSLEVEGDDSRVGKLILVDLAGSERLGVSHISPSNIRTKEAKSINKSLYALGSVISALSSRRPSLHVRYRDSKLTRILQGTIGGIFNTSFVATIDPSVKNTMESISTLQFAHRCKHIECDPLLNKKMQARESLDNNMKVHMERMEKEFMQREALLQASYEERIRQLEKKVEETEALHAASTSPNPNQSLALSTAYKALCEVSDCLDDAHTRRHPVIDVFPCEEVFVTYIEHLQEACLESARSLRKCTSGNDGSENQMHN